MVTLLRTYWAQAVVLVALGVSLPVWVIWVDGTWALHHAIGLALIVPSFILWAIARRQLGASFTGPAEARALVTRGLYSKIRNPIYVFGTVLNVGLCVFYGQPWLFLLLPILLVQQVQRARKEARVLDAAFGDAYRAYRARTWF
ncbi:MAG TPA: isoprenylcysteine carboxylmethyltransferase family protein [Gemmatimonadaceae bacterium]|jgi:protein-S-isoprenylcysteine O-methyltransferase Ste14|nr:isoprenylcysteine carboxylmethyltransferase family protein [Gemmatimonadaceae bacterium]